MKPIKFKVSFDITFDTGNETNEKETDWKYVCFNPFKMGESYFETWMSEYPKEKERFNSWMGTLIAAGTRDYIHVTFDEIPYAKISNVETEEIGR